MECVQLALKRLSRIHTGKTSGTVLFAGKHALLICMRTGCSEGDGTTVAQQSRNRSPERDGQEAGGKAQNE
jgi:hypothetical protein